MFSFIKNLFTAIDTTTPTPTIIFDKEFDMRNINNATIRQMKNGNFRLLSGEFGNEVVGTYTRRRDAVRGATRRGLSLVG